MRFELAVDRSLTICRVANRAIAWIHINGSIESTKFILRHPLVRVYWNICKDNRLQAVKTDIDSRKVAVLLITSLVLL